MRYSKDETAILVGMFPKDLSITIEVLDMENDNLLELKDNAVVESEVYTGVYFWNTDNIHNTTKALYNNLLYKMTPDDKAVPPYYGKFIYSGYIDKPVSVDLQPVLENQAELQDSIDIVQASL